MELETLYQLKAIRNESIHKRLCTWETPRNFDARMLVGSGLGALVTSETCNCCDQVSRAAFFFRTDATDEVHTLMAPYAFGTGIVVCLPDNNHGYFFPDSDEEPVNDARILKVLASCEQTNPTIERLFQHFYEQIRLRTAFRHFYFRAFRTSFAPTGKQGRQAVVEGCAFLRTHFSDATCP